MAKDVCEVLEIANTSDACQNLSKKEKDKSTICTPGGNQEAIIVSESGLYKLIFKSRQSNTQLFLRQFNITL